MITGFICYIFPVAISNVSLLMFSCFVHPQAVPLQFLHALLIYLGDSPAQDDESSGLKSPLASSPSYPGIEMPSEGLVRWQLRLEYFAYETLQDLRIGKLFEIIVDYPERLDISASFVWHNGFTYWIERKQVFNIIF